MDVSIIIVNFNTRPLVLKCLESIFRTTRRLDFEVILVDNASTDGSIKAVVARFPSVEILAQEENLGFARANNLAIKRSRGKFILLLNPDTELVDGVVSILARFLEDHPDAGAAGCRLLNSDGSLQASSYNFPTVPGVFASVFRLKKVIPLRWLREGPLGGWIGSRVRYFDRHLSTQRVDFVTGACMMVKGSVVDEVGLLDESFFIYFEEIDWCYRMREAGWFTYFVPSARALHHIGQSSRQVSRRSFLEMHRSRLHYYRKHFPAASLAVVKAILCVRLGMDLLLAGMRRGIDCLSGKKKRKDGPELYIEAIRICLRG
jgi:GT2 family glycosyltransferase